MTCQTGLQTASVSHSFYHELFNFAGEELRSRPDFRRDNHTDTIAETTSSHLTRRCAAERDHTHTTKKRRSPDVHRQNMLIKIHDHDRVAGANKLNTILRERQARQETTPRHHETCRVFSCTPCAQPSTVARLGLLV